MMQRLKVAVNVRFLLSGRLEGIGYFTHETLRRITRAHPEVDFYFLFDRPFASEFIYASNVHPVVLPPPARHPLLWYLWFELSVAYWLFRHKPDLFLSTDGFCSLHASIPTVAVMHDIAYEYFPQYVPRLTNCYYRYFMPMYARHAARIATVSEHSKRDIALHYHIPEDKIDVVYNGVREIFVPVSNEVREQVRARYTGGAPYLIYVGSVNGRKNLHRMLLAFDRFKSAHACPLKFVIAGSRGWSNRETDEVLRTMKHSKDVVITGRLHDEELALVLGSSLALMYVSLYEGFGVPPLEAMRCGVPCIVSDSSSLPEITSGAALLANAEDVDDIAAKITSIYFDENLRRELIEKGNKRVKSFSWDTSAELLWASCVRALSGSA
ncbi:MAG: glycosyltransferase family 4 protein [Chitinophagales bacterium]|nr:glycosyltransferase family 4 protein [Chitinophagales bacterium]